MVSLTIFSTSHPSVYIRIGEEPMKAAISIGMPARWEISTIGRMSAATVRAAQYARIRIFWIAISRARRSTC